MSARGEQLGGLLARLPPSLRPLDREQSTAGRLRRFESALLVVAAVVLAVATINDLVREIGIGIRLHADLVSWERITGHRYHNPLIEQDVKHYTTKDTVCANTENVKPQGTVQVCLVFVGPVRNGLRRAVGGWYLEARGTDVHEPVLNRYQYRYGCFGRAASEHLCGLAAGPPGAPDKPLLGGG